MSKKFSIIKEIDLDKLRRQIDLFRHETGETNPYLFMSYETMNKICDPLIDWKMFINYNPNQLIARFEGYKVFNDNELSYGEVEIR